MSDIHVVVLAAGKGTRMKSAVPKVLHRIAGRPLIGHVLASAHALAPATTTVVVGHQGSDVTEALSTQPGLSFVVQEPQLGTAHALLMAEPALAGRRGTVVLLSGDVPLLRPQTLHSLVDRHHATGAATTVLTAVVDRPTGYGRIVRSGGQIAGIVEEKDASEAEREIREINAGIYAFDLDGLFDAVRAIASENAQREYYLPDLVGIHRRAGRVVETLALGDPREILGINTRAELARLGALYRMTKNEQLMADGVTLTDPATTYVDADVVVGADTILEPGVSLERGTTVGRGCHIQDGAFIGSDTQLIAPVTIGRGAYVGTGTTVREDVPPDALAVSAGKQRNIDGWVSAKRARASRGRTK